MEESILNNRDGLCLSEVSRRNTLLKDLADNTIKMTSTIDYADNLPQIVLVELEENQGKRIQGTSAHPL
jgi:hypothetical protein